MACRLRDRRRPRTETERARARYQGCVAARGRKRRACRGSGAGGLRLELNIVEKVIALEAVELLQSLKPEQLARIAGIATEISFAAGKTVLDPSQPGAALMIVIEGSVELSRNGEVLMVARQTMCWAHGRCSTTSPAHRGEGARRDAPAENSPRGFLRPARG